MGEVEVCEDVAEERAVSFGGVPCVVQSQAECLGEKEK
jgi:hypothetical protein